MPSTAVRDVPVVRERNRQSTRRSTRGETSGTEYVPRERKSTRNISTRTNNKKPSQASVATVSDVTDIGVQRKRRTSTRQASTRRNSSASPERPSTRQRASTRPSTRGSTRSTSSTRPSTRSNQVSQEPVTRQRATKYKIKIFKEDAFKKKQEPQETDSVWKHSEYSEPMVGSDKRKVNRTMVYGQKREQARYIAPINFLVVIFLAICISVVAFGILRSGEEPALIDDDSPNGGYVEVLPTKPSTSTNTGILRGNND